MNANETNGAGVIVRSLIDLGVEIVFGYPGGAVLPIYDALFEQEAAGGRKIKHILVRHEQAAVHAA
ncbi:MAG: thiamine pyrophosphate-binding protein, partial [Janthinobacterium lividum]